MKKYYKLSVAVIAITALFQFSGCQDEIFNEIRDEIKLEDSTVSGHINSIIRFNPNGGGTEYIAIQNGGIYYRNAAVETETDWTKDSRTAGQVSKIAADKENIYALYTDWKEDLDEGEWVRNSTSIVCKKNIEDSWTKIYTVDSNTNVSLFCTNAKQKGNRKAYVRIGSTGVYELTGTTWPALLKVTGDTNASTEPTKDSNSCAWLEGKVYFFNGLASASNETATDDASMIYYASGSTVYYSSDGSTWNSQSAGDVVYSISYTSDYLCLGTDAGYQQMPHSGGIPTGSANDNFSNASSTLSSYYEVWAVLAVNPEKTQAGNTIFASLDYSGSSSSTSAVFDNIGLWGYYSDRAKWNRE